MCTCTCTFAIELKTNKPNKKGTTNSETFNHNELTSQYLQIQTNRCSNLYKEVLKKGYNLFLLLFNQHCDLGNIFLKLPPVRRTDHKKLSSVLFIYVLKK